MVWLHVKHEAQNILRTFLKMNFLSHVTTAWDADKRPHNYANIASLCADDDDEKSMMRFNAAYCEFCDWKADTTRIRC